MKVPFERRVILSFELTIYGRRVRENIHMYAELLLLIYK